MDKEEAAGASDRCENNHLEKHQERFPSEDYEPELGCIKLLRAKVSLQFSSEGLCLQSVFLGAGSSLIPALHKNKRSQLFFF